MIRYLKDYVSDYEKELNIALMNKEADLPLVEYVEDTWKSLEIVKNIKIVKFEYNENESDIDINRHIFKREKKKKKKDRYDYKFVHDDRYSCLTVYIQITIEEEDPSTHEKSIRQKLLKKQMLIPLQDEDGYYFIKGKKYYAIYQLVDKSTYTSKSAVTLKSLMPIGVKRTSLTDTTVIPPDIANNQDFRKGSVDVKDINGAEFLLPVYSVYVFKKEIPIILFYGANGLDWALSYLGVDKIISFKENLNNTDKKNLYFQISSKCYIEVNRMLFLKYPYIQSIVGMFLHVCTNRTSVDDLYDKFTWIKKLSNNNTIEKGQDILIFFNRLMDETTRKILKMSAHNKDNVYAILRWMMQNYNELRLKDNLNLNNKRLRCNEYIASLLTAEFSKRLNNVITLGNKATMDDFLNMFKFGGQILIQKMH